MFPRYFGYLVYTAGDTPHFDAEKPIWSIVAINELFILALLPSHGLVLLSKDDIYCTK